MKMKFFIAKVTSMKNLYHYFKRNLHYCLPTGLLCKEVPTTAIGAANKEVMDSLKHSEDQRQE